LCAARPELVKIIRYSSSPASAKNVRTKKYAGEPTTLSIGDNNVIREACTFHRGTVQDAGHTQVGSHNLFMVNVHVAHDAIIGDHCILANDTNVAGHVNIGDYVILGGATQVHQFCHIGAHSMCGAGSVVLKDIPAYVMSQGYPVQPHGINIEGLKRRGFAKASINRLRAAYKTLYRQGLTLEEALLQLEPVAAEDEAVAVLVASLKAGNRGIIR